MRPGQSCVAGEKGVVEMSFLPTPAITWLGKEEKSSIPGTMHRASPVHGLIRVLCCFITPEKSHHPCSGTQDKGRDLWGHLLLRTTCLCTRLYVKHPKWVQTQHWGVSAILVFSPGCICVCRNDWKEGPLLTRDEHVRAVALLGNDTLAALQQAAPRSLQQAGTREESSAPRHGTCGRKTSADVVPSLGIFFLQ